MDTYHGLRAWFRARPPWVLDGVIALVVSLVPLWVLASVPPETPGMHGYDGLTPGIVALTLLTGVPLLWRRTHPSLVLSVVGLSMVAAAAFSVPLQGFGLLVALYTYAAYSTKDDGAVTLLIFGAFTMVSLVLADAVGLAGVNALVILTAWVLGDRTRAHRTRTADLERRATALERDRDVRARLAVAQERNRIAGELHHVVSHGVTAMIAQASAAERIMGGDPERAGTVLLDVEQTGRASLVELRRLLGVLRTSADEPTLAPQPTLADVHDLVEAFSEVGLPVSLEVEGDAGSATPAVQLSAYRIVQEGLTNVLCHARATQVEVRLRVEGGWLHLEVVDDGVGPDAALAVSDADPATADGGPGDRGGLAGLRERVQLFGGALTCGPRVAVDGVAHDGRPGCALVARLPQGGRA